MNVYDPYDDPYGPEERRAPAEKNRRARVSQRHGKGQGGGNLGKPATVEERRKRAIARFKAQSRPSRGWDEPTNWDEGFPIPGISSVIDVAIGAVFLFVFVWVLFSVVISLFTGIGFPIVVGLIFAFLIVLLIGLLLIAIKWLLNKLTPTEQPKYRGD